MIKRVLIIEDDEEMCDEIGDLLKDEGFDVDSLCDGSKAISVVESGKYDLVLLDLKIPGNNSVEILKNVKDKRPATKVLIITGSLLKGPLANGEKKKQLRAADAIIQKPFDIKKLLRKIKSFN